MDLCSQQFSLKDKLGVVVVVVVVEMQGTEQRPPIWRGAVPSKPHPDRAERAIISL